LNLRPSALSLLASDGLHWPLLASKIAWRSQEPNGRKAIRQERLHRSCLRRSVAEPQSDRGHIDQSIDRTCAARGGAAANAEEVRALVGLGDGGRVALLAEVLCGGIPTVAPVREVHQREKH